MRIATRTRSWMEIVARTGYTAVAIVYLLLGALALRLALGNSRQAPDAQSAILEVGATSCGRFFLGLLAAGLVAFTIWRVVEAIFNPKHARRAL
jgi:predicted small integral membrane protein